MHFSVLYLVQHFMLGKDIEIVADRLIGMETGTVYPDFHEYILDNILSLLGILDQVKDKAIELGIILLKEDFKT